MLRTLILTLSALLNFGATAHAGILDHIFPKSCKDYLSEAHSSNPEPYAVAMLNPNAAVFDVKTNQPISTHLQDWTAVLVYTSTPAVENLFKQYLISFVDRDGRQQFATTLDYNLKFLNDERYVVNGQKIPLAELQKQINKERVKPAASPAKVKSETKKSEAKQNDRSASLQTQLSEALTEKDGSEILLSDYVNSLWIKSLVYKHSRNILLLTGAADSRDFAPTLKLAKIAVERGCIVGFDADAPSAHLIAEAVGSRGVGITGKSVPPDTLMGDSQIVPIVNPYLRLKAFEQWKNRTATVDSPSGWGLLFVKEIDRTLDPSREGMQSRLVRWSNNISGPSLGVRHNFDYRMIYNETNPAEAIRQIAWLYFWGSAPVTDLKPIRMNRERSVAKLYDSDIKTIFGYQKQMLEGSFKLDAEKPSKGAVLFGSNSGDSHYEKLITAVATAISKAGYPVLTGGAGGFMRLANAAAKNAGGLSIGIPMAGVTGEKEAATDVHSLTIPVKSYEVRIPLLLRRNDLVVILPGGKGTLKELATTFVNLASADSDQKIIFVSKEFYGDLFRFLKESELPESIRSRFYLVDSGEQMTELLKETASGG